VTRRGAGADRIRRRASGRAAFAALAIAAALASALAPAGPAAAAPAATGRDGMASRDPAGPAATTAAAITTVVTRGYDLGRAQLSVLGADGRPHRLPTRLVGEITVRTGTSGRSPVVVILHGAHQSCAEGPDGTVSSDFPCLPGWEPVESYTGYRYLAERLAREGFLVVSVDGRPVAPYDHTNRPFPDGAEAGVSTWMDLRALIVDTHLRRLVRAGHGEIGPAVDFGVRLAGRVDASNVGLVGHSRGGEGVVWASLLEGPRPYRVRSVVTIAPTDFADRVVPPGVPFAVLLPTCDGDVSDLQGARFYDEARNTPRTRPLLQVAIHGANHDFFNEVWPDEWGVAAAGTAPVDPTGFCDPGSPSRLTRPRQEAVGASIVSDFLRGTMRGAPAALAALGIGTQPPRAIAGVPVTARTQEPTAGRIDVAPMDGSPYQLAQTAGGGRITPAGLDYLALCRPGTVVDVPYSGDEGDGRTEACPPAWFAQAQVADELRAGWSSPGGRLVLAPSPRPVDLRGVAAVSLSIAPTPPDADPDLNGAGSARPFSVALVDASGRRAIVPISSAEPAVRSWPTVTVLGTVRVPIARFRGVDLGRIARLELVFDRTARGAVVVSDVAFLR
jgi:dienelactone hydrolase